MRRFLSSKLFPRSSALGGDLCGYHFAARTEELSALPQDAYGRIRDSIRDLAQEPRPNSSKKLAGRSVPDRDQYNQDGLVTIHNHDFMESPTFKAAYQRGVKVAGTDYNWHWRVHIDLWAAAMASKLPGDFVECGVNRGFLSSAIMQFLEWDRLGKQFYLLDTFRGIDVRYVSSEELASGVMEKSKTAIDSGFYVVGSQSVRANFSEWKNTRIIEGPIPETLPEVAARQIAFCHIDMNCSSPEVAALSCFWDRLVLGAVVLLDDYAYYGYQLPKTVWTGLRRERGWQSPLCRPARACS